MPISGKIIEINGDLENNPEAINQDPYEKGWMAKIEIENQEEISELLDVTEYTSLVNIE